MDHPAPRGRRDVIDGVPIEPGATMAVSPLITQRMRQFWDRPDEFDPERFRPERVGPGTGRPLPVRRRPAPVPWHVLFYGGPAHLATMLSRYRFRLHRP
ncbi:cytochrome P450, partial [Micromonospora sp. WMMB482]|uniref:cytochrome P450 n=1 Tax=Micromonospora sp. WMMB482 TaxID=2849653 RepID=UPI0027E127ED